MDIDGTGLRQLTDWAINASYPNWSPDGTRILFNDNSNNGSATTPLDVWVMDADGSAKTRLTHITGRSWAFGADWSPDGTKIVYVAASDVHSLAVMDADGANSALLWTDPGRSSRRRRLGTKPVTPATLARWEFQRAVHRLHHAPSHPPCTFDVAVNVAVRRDLPPQKARIEGSLRRRLARGRA